MFEPKIKKMNLFVRILTFGWAAAITLAPFGIYVKEKYFELQKRNPNLYKSMINEEKIHWYQQLWMLIIIFYPFYLIEWFIKLFFYGKKAYYNISFEREAKLFKYDDYYYMTRKKWASFKYIFKKE